MGGAIAAVLAGLGMFNPIPMMRQEPPSPEKVSGKGKRRRRRSQASYGGGRSRTTLHAINGDRECLRRMTQIALGQLREQNGLVR